MPEFESSVRTCVVQAISFGFGPASHATAIAGALDAKVGASIHLVGVGEGIAAEFMEQSGAFDVVLHGNVEKGEVISDAVGEASCVVSVGDFDFIRACAAQGKPAALVDALYWMWDEDPLPLDEASLYFVLDFPGVRQRLAAVGKPGRHAVVVPQIVSYADALPDREGSDKRCIVINFGGVVTPFGTPFDFVGAMLKDILAVIGDVFDDVVVAGGAPVMRVLEQRFGGDRSGIRFGPFSAPEFLRYLASCQRLLTVPGMSVAVEASVQGVPTLFLPGLNYSQHRQIDIFADLFPDMRAIRWSDIPGGWTLPAGMPEQEAVAQAIAMGEKFTSDQSQRAAFRSFLESHIQEADWKPLSGTLASMDGGPFGGAEQIADVLLKEVAGQGASL